MNQPPRLPGEARALRRLVRALFARPNLLHVGWGVPALLFAFLLTMLSYFILNTWLTDRIVRAYDQMVLPELAESTSSAQAAEAVLDFTQGDPILRPWLRRALIPKRPASEQLEDLFAAVSGEPESTAAARRQLVRGLIVGRRRGVRVFWLSSPSTITGKDIVKAVEDLDGGSWGKTLEAQDHKSAKRATLVQFSDRLLNQMGGPIRTLNRISGWIQWAIIYLFWLILVTLARRGIMLWRLSRGAAREGPNDDWIKLLNDDRYRGMRWPAQAEWYRDGFSRLRTALENDVYGTFSFLLGLLPSAGFIGTVEGIGSALLAASDLFNPRNKEQAIGKITLNLGYAFDATFLALLLGAIAGVVAVIYRLIEQGRLRKWEAELMNKWSAIKNLQHASLPPSEYEPASVSQPAKFSVDCPHCRTANGLALQHLGQKVRCVRCAGVFTIPVPANGNAEILAEAASLIAPSTKA